MAGVSRAEVPRTMSCTGASLCSVSAANSKPPRADRSLFPIPNSRFPAPRYSRQNCGVSSTSTENTSSRPSTIAKVPSQTATGLTSAKLEATAPRPGPRSWE